jgi:hypothetical protein
MGGLFSGSKRPGASQSQSSNRAYDFLQGAFGGLTSNAAQGTNAIQALLSGDTSGFDAYKRATGFNAQAEQGSRGVTGNAAASGLLRSGGAGKALQAYGQNLQNQAAGSYMDRLQSLADTGFKAGGLIGSAGQQSTSNTESSKGKPGIGDLLMSAASSVALSDRRLKENIVKMGTLKNGLNVYKYNYLNEDDTHLGVMADEVAAILPEALGPVINGYNTVDYSKIEMRF